MIIMTCLQSSLTNLMCFNYLEFRGSFFDKIFLSTFSFCLVFFCVPSLNYCVFYLIFYSLHFLFYSKSSLICKSHQYNKFTLFVSLYPSASKVVWYTYVFLYWFCCSTVVKCSIWTCSFNLFLYNIWLPTLFF